jgi:hypothetical protein
MLELLPPLRQNLHTLSSKPTPHLPPPRPRPITHLTRNLNWYDGNPIYFPLNGLTADPSPFIFPLLNQVSCQESFGVCILPSSSSSPSSGRGTSSVAPIRRLDRRVRDLRGSKAVSWRGRWGGREVEIFYVLARVMRRRRWDVNRGGIFARRQRLGGLSRFFVEAVVNPWYMSSDDREVSFENFE